MYQTTLDFLGYLFDFFHSILAYEFIAGITLKTIFLYNLLLIAFFHVFAKRS